MAPYMTEEGRGGCDTSKVYNGENSSLAAFKWTEYLSLTTLLAHDVPVEHRCWHIVEKSKCNKREHLCYIVLFTSRNELGKFAGKQSQYVPANNENLKPVDTQGSALVGVGTKLYKFV